MRIKEVFRWGASRFIAVGGGTKTVPRPLSRFDTHCIQDGRPQRKALDLHDVTEKIGDCIPLPSLTKSWKMRLPKTIW